MIFKYYGDFCQHIYAFDRILKDNLKKWDLRYNGGFFHLG
jgi:hypothetical protein